MTWEFSPIFCTYALLHSLTQKTAVSQGYTKRSPKFSQPDSRPSPSHCGPSRLEWAQRGGLRPGGAAGARGTSEGGHRGGRAAAGTAPRLLVRDPGSVTLPSPDSGLGNPQSQPSGQARGRVSMVTGRRCDQLCPGTCFRPSPLKTTPLPQRDRYFRD